LYCCRLFQRSRHFLNFQDLNSILIVSIHLLKFHLPKILPKPSVISENESQSYLHCTSEILSTFLIILLRAPNVYTFQISRSPFTPLSLILSHFQMLMLSKFRKRTHWKLFEIPHYALENIYT
jgi:hypothetical protein